MRLFVVLSVLLATFGASVADVLLNRVPFLMSHDAATGEIVESRDYIVADWAKTQSVGLVGQLDCGARSFDYRPYYKDGQLSAHHGGVKIHKPMKESMVDIISWANAHKDDMILVYLSHFDGDEGCQSASIDLMKSLNIFTVTQCSDLASLTYNAAMLKSRNVLGGHVLAVVDCMDEKFDSTINCYGKDFVCYDSWPENSANIPWDHMKSYVNQTAHLVPPSDGMLWMNQMHWQSTVISITYGTLHRSNLLLDEEKSAVNKWVANQISTNSLPYMNIIEVDNVCDNGNAIQTAISEYKSKVLKL